MNRISAAVGAALLTLATSQAIAQRTQNEMSAHDKTFLTTAATGGMAEVSLGELAQRNASSAQVKRFGERMVTDHGKSNDQLKAIAKSQDLTVPTNVDSAHRATEQRLAAMKGQPFDQAYLRDMVQDHHQDISDFRQEANGGQNAALRMFAQQNLPILQQHLQMAESMSSTGK